MTSDYRSRCLPICTATILLGTTFTQTTPDSEIAVMLQGVTFQTMVYGHLHSASAARRRNGQLFSIGSVGFPYDGDPRAAYALADWDGREWKLAHRRVDYDHESVARAVERSDMPFAARNAAMLRAANWLPRAGFREV